MIRDLEFRPWIFFVFIRICLSSEAFWSNVRNDRYLSKADGTVDIAAREDAGTPLPFVTAFS